MDKDRAAVHGDGGALDGQHLAVESLEGVQQFGNFGAGQASVTEWEPG